MWKYKILKLNIDEVGNLTFVSADQINELGYAGYEVDKIKVDENAQIRFVLMKRILKQLND